MKKEQHNWEILKIKDFGSALEVLKVCDKCERYKRTNYIIDYSKEEKCNPKK